MSQLNSDFDAGELGFEEVDETPSTTDAPPPAPVYRQRGFSIYTVMLICSFVFLTAAAIVFFIEAGKY